MAKYTELSALGEFGLINHLTSSIHIKNSSTIKGVGDDAAVVDYGNKKFWSARICLSKGYIST